MHVYNTLVSIRPELHPHSPSPLHSKKYENIGWLQGFDLEIMATRRRSRGRFFPHIPVSSSIAAAGAIFGSVGSSGFERPLHFCDRKDLQKVLASPSRAW